jgi:hypothetical protein
LATLHWEKPPRFLLNSRGFHWINERAFNNEPAYLARFQDPGSAAQRREADERGEDGSWAPDSRDGHGGEFYAIWSGNFALPP